MKKLLWTVTIGMAAALAGCGGGSGEQTLVVTQDAQVPVTSSVTSAVVQTPFTFPSGVASFGTSAPTTVTFTSTAATPAFTVTSGSNTASGTTTFGSCIFTVTASTFPADSPLATGKVITVNPCTLTVDTSGTAADGTPDTVAGTLVLGTIASDGANVSIAVSPSGDLLLNGTPLDVVVPVTPLSGS